MSNNEFNEWKEELIEQLEVIIISFLIALPIGLIIFYLFYIR